MLFSRDADQRAKLEALNKSQAIIEFEMDGTIITANQNFLNALGYTLVEVQGKHHSMFVSERDSKAPGYRQFWESLNRGEFQSAEYKRVGKGGKEVWIQASYNPLMNRSGKPFKVIKFAADVTAQKLQSIDFAGQVDAITRSQAVIHFALDGTVLEANENFLKTLGYTLNEIKGRHHSLFVIDEEKKTVAYRQFWEALNRGEFQAAEYKRVGKGGKEVWIQATYNPILDPTDGRPMKVVKFATDITAQVQDRIRKAGIQHAMDADIGDITTAVTSANEQSARAADASQQTSANVQAVASGAEELVASISEISRRVADAAQISGEAVAQSEKTQSVMSNLTTAAQRIGEVVTMIQTVAAQTNLLALNATIEAARAGEAGRGFAVVATEVKALANQTTRATEEISSQIASVQQATVSAASAIEEIGVTINKLNEIATTIAAAIEEQNSVTQDISSNMHTASKGVDTISQNMNEIALMTKSASDSAVKVKNASRALVA